MWRRVFDKLTGQRPTPGPHSEEAAPTIQQAQPSKALGKYHEGRLGQALVDNLNRNVLAERAQNARTRSADPSLDPPRANLAAALFAEVKASHPELSDETIRQMIDEF